MSLQGDEKGDARVRTPFLRLLAFLKPYRWVFAGSLLLTVFSALFDAFSLLLLIPFLRSLFGMGPLLPDGGRNHAERLIDWVAGDWLGGAEALVALRTVCLLVLATIVAKNLCLYAGKVLSIQVQNRVERDVRDRVHGHLQRLPLGYFERTKTGQLISRVMSDPGTARPIVSFQLAELVRQVATVAAYLTILFLLSPRLTLIALVLVPVVTLVLRPVLGRLRTGYRRVYDQRGDLLSLLQETISGIRLVKAYGAESSEEARFRSRSNEYSRSQIRTEATAHLASPLSEVLASLVALALIWVGARLVLNTGALGPEQFLAFVTIALRSTSPIKAISQFPAALHQALAAADRFLEVLDAPREAIRVAGARDVDRFEREIRFEDVAFSYEPDKPVLRGLDLTVGVGEVVALVGPSGGGKSTLVDLLPRFIDPDRGRVLLDGVDLRTLSLSSLRSLMGIVSQETTVFHDTVRANIAYGDSGRWSAAEVEAAARAAHAHEFIVNLPEGYETLLGDRGVRLSGGERQRIGIARAILRDPPILILDEATSSLDSESERWIQEALKHLFRERTVIVIAHRLSTVKEADRILVLEAGRLEDSGRHPELLARDGLYRRLFEGQLEGVPAPAG
jgi:subfamily B ATP-binding cassette protein MsbA